MPDPTPQHRETADHRAAPDTLDVEVFRAGDYGPRGRYSPADLDALCDDYDPQLHEAPVTLDHRQQGPADGWVRRLARAGDRIVASLADLSPRLRELLERHAYKKRSVELYRAHAATGRPYLKAVSFLGAATPAVPGMADPVFESDGPHITFTADGEETRQREVPQCPATSRAAAAAAARDRLAATGHWHPAWDTGGVTDAFAELAESGHLDSLIDALEALPPAVPVDKEEPAAFSGTGTGFGPGASPASVRRHDAAMAALAQDPSLSYAEALLRTNP